jgi:Na+/H+-dicarboxylate symporter
MRLLRLWNEIALWKRVLGALALGVLLGAFFPAAAPAIKIVGQLFMRLIQMLVVPVVLVAVSAGIAQLGEIRRLGIVASRTVLVFAGTTLVGVAIGMIVGLILQPGATVRLAADAVSPLGPPKTGEEQLLGIFAPNIFEALAAGNMLAILIFAGLIGVATLAAGKEGEPFAALLRSATAVILRAVGFVMQLTPFGVFALVANAVAANGVGVIADIRWLALGVVLFVILQIFIVHASLLALIAKRNIFGFLRSISDALAIAFSTSSSAATLPVALRVAEERLGLPKAVAATTLPLGASIGKDGTAAYVGLLSIFALQALGVPITPAALAIILLAGSFAAFGTAPMPSASLFMLAAVLSAVGVDPAHTALVVAFVLPFDRLLDMTRTIASASANLTVATVVTALAPEVVDEVGEDQRAD